MMFIFEIHIDATNTFFLAELILYKLYTGYCQRISFSCKSNRTTHKPHQKQQKQNKFISIQ